MEKLFWSIAFPGFGQILNGKLVKGFVLIFLELLINVQANFNKVIMLSFHGDIISAIEQTNYQWLMFYPCLYMFAMWDAYRDAGKGKSPYSFLPFVFSAYFVTVGLIYSSSLKVFGVLFGYVFLPMLFLIPGISIGFLRKIALRNLNISRA
ncbi:hypothetical protein [Metabacillus rhizolycopersici]|uniref:Uncharacterized protein n=1 Tax=Metabacillus rhizolycopersici TaxID=2875709 RepID=A0ABS7UML8_9BACI|nr:hypothetical protein [Metabacillus rhizolycopersici]MBZ5749555.1 hypothetical protein [Metabacillus rhizolycopersici]